VFQGIKQNIIIHIEFHLFFIAIMSKSNETRTAQDVASAALIVTYINIVLYALCYQLQRPVEPFLVQQLSKDGSSNGDVTRTYGQLQSFFSTIQTIGSPLVGILLDRLGVRLASTIVFASSALSYYILSIATTLPALFYSKIPTALQHAFLVAQAVAAIACQGDEAARAQALGRVTTAYTIGATLGPAMGGYLAEHGDLYVGAKWAVAGSILSVILSLLFLPDEAASKVPNGTSSSDVPVGVHNDTDDDKVIKKKRSFMEELKHSAEIATRSGLWPLLVIKVISGVASSMFDTALPIVLTQQLHFDPAALGIMMSSSMFASAAFGVVGIHMVTKMLGAIGMIQWSLLLRPVLNFFVATIVSSSITPMEFVPTTMTTTSLMICTTTLRGLASHALSTGLTTRSTGIVSTQEQGTLLGLEHGLFSMARIAGPTLGTGIYTWTGNSFWAVAVACGCTDVSLLAVLTRVAWHTNPNNHKNKHP
jgi:MFS transporter, OCT family, solute carrier family 22 (organic cation transporter), member 18